MQISQISLFPSCKQLKKLFLRNGWKLLKDKTEDSHAHGIFLKTFLLPNYSIILYKIIYIYTQLIDSIYKVKGLTIKNAVLTALLTCRKITVYFFVNYVQFAIFNIFLYTKYWVLSRSSDFTWLNKLCGKLFSLQKKPGTV